jgi:hypothetical protein
LEDALGVAIRQNGVGLWAVRYVALLNTKVNVQQRDFARVSRRAEYLELATTGKGVNRH